MTRRVAPSITAAFLVVALVACQAASPTTTATTLPAPPSTSTTTTIAPWLRVAVVDRPSSLNWWAALSATGSALDRARLQGATASLFTVTGLEPVPDLAAMPVAVPRPEGEGWVVEQRIDANRTWSDGAPMRAADLVFYFEAVRSMGLDGVHATYFPPEVTAIEAIDDYTLRIRFTGVPGPGLWPGAVGLAPFVPAHFWAKSGVTDLLSLYGWSGAPPPHAAKWDVDWVEAADRTGAYRMLLNGEADFVYDERGISGLDPALVSELAADPGIEMVTSVRTELRVLAFNQRSAPLDDPAVRLALATVVDREALADELGVAVADTFTRPVPTGESGTPAGPGTFDGERLDRASRIDRALSLLEDAGYAATAAAVRPLEILVSDADPVRVASAESIARRMTELGLVVSVVALPPEDLADRVLPPIRPDEAASWDMAVLGWRPTAPDPGDLLINLFHSAEDSVTGGGINVTGFRSPTFDSLAGRYRATTDLRRAASILDEMELALAAEVPQLPLYRELLIEATRVESPFTSVAGGIATNPGSWPDRKP